MAMALSAAETTEVTVLRRPLVAVIAGPSQLEVWRSGQLRLDAQGVPRTPRLGIQCFANAFQ